MNKGYWVVRGCVHDKNEYSKYIEVASGIIHEFNGRFLVRGGEQTEYEERGYNRTVIVEFNSYDDALSCYNSDKYQSALEIVERSATRLVSVVKGV
tara:strand:+ start:2269 stop:2556 length:288 start_codon:yes stop_codon:yes gene_type:complete